MTTNKRQKTLRYAVCFLTTFVLCFGSVFFCQNPETAMDTSVCPGVEVCFAATNSSAKTIKVNKVTEEVAKKLHKQLKSGKAVNLQVKGNAKDAANKIKKLQKKIKNVNKQGVLFQCEKGQTKNGYTNYLISKDNAKLYKYSIKFIKKLFGYVKDWYSIEQYQIMYQDYLAIPDEKTRMLRTAYDYLVLLYTKSNTYHLLNNYEPAIQAAGEELSDFRAAWRNPPTEEDIAEFDDLYFFSYIGADAPQTMWSQYLYENIWTVFPQEYLKQNILGKNVYRDGNVMSIELYSFEEFCANSEWVEMFTSEELWFEYAHSGTGTMSTAKKEGFFYLFLRDGEAMFLQCENFCELSDALKVLAIDSSQYFDCHFERPAFGMIYKISGSTETRGYKGMKNLLENKAQGSCMTYSGYEKLVCDQLGIPCYYNVSTELWHEWTVIVAENSKGKNLWIPFDYGIGPNEMLQADPKVKKRVFQTTASAYKYYLDGILEAPKGNPKKKNFTGTDFN